MNKERLPIVAIVGEPNVGKSTLLNKIAGTHVAITSNVAGTTRDRQYTDSSWNGVNFTMVDTAGITFGQRQELEGELSEQIEVAFNEADFIMLVVDGKEEENIIDRKALLKFRKSKKPVALVVNKLDSPKKFVEFGDSFKKLGIKNIFPVSATTGRGIGDLLDFVASSVKDLSFPAPEKTIGIPVAIVGKPNVGKSSFINKLLGENRVVVSPIPGTTRTSIDVEKQINGVDYTFIDTAGLKRKAYRQEQPDVFSVFQTFKSIRKSEVVLFLIDATQEITKQDLVIAGEIVDLSKGVIIVVNKMDAFDGDMQTLRDYVSKHFPYLWFSPLVFISAKTGEGIDDVIAAIKPINEARSKTVPQEELDKLLERTLIKNGPKLMRDQRKPKVYGLTQTGTASPMFELLVNFPGAISTQYKRFLQKTIVTDLDFWGTPIKLTLRKK